MTSDNLSRELRNVVFNMTKGFEKMKGGKSVQRSLRSAAESTYKNNAWPLIWSIPQVVTVCQNPSDQCVTSSYVGTLDQISSAYVKLRGLASDARKFAVKQKTSSANMKRIKKLEARAESIVTELNTIKAKLPKANSKC